MLKALVLLGSVIAVTLAEGEVDLEFSSVASGLCGPRGLRVQNNWLYVAETGQNTGDVCGFENGEGAACISATGKVSRISLDDSHVEVVDQGLFSFGTNPNQGPCAVDFAPNGDRLIAIGYGYHKTAAELAAAGATNGWQASSVLRYSCVAPPPAPNMGMGMQAPPTPVCSYSKVADSLGEEVANDFDGLGIDSNVFGMTVSPVNPNNVIVADAGGNSVSSYNIANGQRISTVVLPQIERPCLPAGAGPCGELPPGVGPFFCCSFNPDKTTYTSQPVPTNLLARPGFRNELYVTQLTGAIWSSDQASVWRFTAEPLAIGEMFVTGFNSIISGAFDGPMRLFVLEQNFFSLGSFQGKNRLTLVNMQTRAKTVLSTNLNFATHLLAVNGVLYASNNGLAPCAGDVMKVDLYSTPAGCPCSVATPCYNARTGQCSATRGPRARCAPDSPDVCDLLQ